MHKPTRLQRRIIQYMRKAPGVTRFKTGHKQTAIMERASGELHIYCQSTVLYFLRHHGYVREAAGIGAWELTDKGIQACL